MIPRAASDTDHSSLVTAALHRMGLMAEGEAVRCTPLTGGVSSDIWKVETGRRVMAVKRARGQLKVATEWRAPVERNAYEVRWFRVAGAAVPNAVPEILGEDREAGLFAMAYLDPAQYPIWKSELRDGRVTFPSRPRWAGGLPASIRPPHFNTKSPPSSLPTRPSTPSAWRPISKRPRPSIQSGGEF